MSLNTPGVYVPEPVQLTVYQSSRDWYYENKEKMTHIVSIVCPDDDITPLHNHHLVVKFWDIDHTMTNKFRHYPVVTKKQAMLPIEVVHKWRKEATEPMRLLIHCDAGISRSAAVALGVLWSFVDGDVFLDVAGYKTPVKNAIESGKEMCKELLDEDNTQLRRFIDGRFNPGVQPNQAVIKIYRDEMDYFPW